LESAWAEPFTFDVEDAVEEPTACRKRDALHVAMENPQESGTFHGKTRNSTAKEHGSLHWLMIFYVLNCKSILLCGCFPFYL
jgi:hypothetical protein